MKCLRLLLSLILLPLVVCPAWAQDSAAVGPVSQAVSAPVPPPETVATAPAPRYLGQVVRVSSLTGQDSSTVRLGDHVMVEVTNLAQLLQTNNRKPDELRLFINDIALRDLKPVSTDIMNGKVVFLLERKNSDGAYWKMFYGSIAEFEYPARIGIGVQESQLANPFPADNKTLNLVLVQKENVWWGLGLIVALGFFIVWMGSRSLLLRNDNSKQQTSTGAVDVVKVPFSISKSQLALWTFLVVSGYFIIWVVTGELPGIPENLLALLGISLTSELVAKGINNKQEKEAPLRHQDKPSEGFFADILSDENGLSMPRLQFLLFNLVIAASFVRTVIKDWALPNFDLATLALLSISGAGYLVYKNTENHNPAPTPGPVPPGNPPPGNLPPPVAAPGQNGDGQAGQVPAIPVHPQRPEPALPG